MDRSIVALDGSDLSERAIGLGETFARLYAARLKLVHVLVEPVASDLLPDMMIPDHAGVEQYLGRNGRGGLGRLVFGSVADKVVRNASVPVALVRSAIAQRHGLRELLVPLDDSQYGEAVLHLTVDLAERRDAAIGLSEFVSRNGEALLIAAGQNLKRLLSCHGWGRRPSPGGARGVMTRATGIARFATA